MFDWSLRKIIYKYVSENTYFSIFEIVKVEYLENSYSIKKLQETKYFPSLIEKTKRNTVDFCTSNNNRIINKHLNVKFFNCLKHLRLHKIFKL